MKRIEISVDEQCVSVENVASHLDVAKDSVYRLNEDKGLPALNVGRLFRFKLSDIDESVWPYNEPREIPNLVQKTGSSKSWLNRAKDIFTRAF